MSFFKGGRHGRLFSCMIRSKNFDFIWLYGIFLTYSMREESICIPFSMRVRSSNHIFTLKSSIRINKDIRAPELRIIAQDGENLGVMSRADALTRAKDAGLDLILVTEDAKPPIAKIADYGKYLYEQKKKAKEVKAKSHTSETKGIQVKVATSEGDLTVKAKRVAKWLGEKHRVKIDLFLSGRYKYMDHAFLKERLERFVKLIPGEHRMAEPIKKSPKGFSTIIEPVKKK